MHEFFLQNYIVSAAGILHLNLHLYFTSIRLILSNVGYGEHMILNSVRIGLETSFDDLYDYKENLSLLYESTK